MLTDNEEQDLMLLWWITALLSKNNLNDLKVPTKVLKFVLKHWDIQINIMLYPYSNNFSKLS